MNTSIKHCILCAKLYLVADLIVELLSIPTKMSTLLISAYMSITIHTLTAIKSSRRTDSDLKNMVIVLSL